MRGRTIGSLVAMAIGLAGCSSGPQNEVVPVTCDGGGEAWHEVTGDKETRWCRNAEGLPDGPWSRTEDGVLREEGVWANGVADGEWRGYHANGADAWVQTWSLGHPCGEWRSWEEDGELDEALDLGDCDAEPEQPDPEPELPMFPGCPDDRTLVESATEMRCVTADGTLDGPWAQRVGESIVVLGAWADGERTGEWTWFSPMGLPTERGAYDAGKKQGEWLTFWTNGQVQQRATWIDGVLDGPWQTFYASGNPKDSGAWEAGEQVGVWTAFHPGGATLCKRPYVSGLVHGLERCWDVDGNPTLEREVEWGLGNGIQIVWFDHWLLGERVRSEGILINDQPTGEVQSFWDADGSAAGTYRFQSGVRQGPYIEYWPSGGTLDEGFYVAGRVQYTRRTYYEDGTQWSEAVYFAGRVNGQYTEWWPNGQMKVTGVLSNDKRFGVWTFWTESGEMSTEDYGAWGNG